MSRLGILNEFGVRLDGINAKQRRLALPAMDAPKGYTDPERLAHIQALITGIEADIRRGRRVDDRYLTEIGAYALAWIDAQRVSAASNTTRLPDGGAA